MFSGVMDYLARRPPAEVKQQQSPPAPAAPLTRFESTLEFKSVFDKIKEIKVQDQKLSDEAKGAGAHGKEYEKHTVLDDLLIRLKGKIDEFDREEATQERETELRSIIRLAFKLSIIATQVRDEAGITLNAQRGHATQIAKASVDVGTHAAMFGAATLATTFTMGAAAGTLLFAPGASSLVKNAIGLNEKKAYSFVLVEQLVETLDGLAKNLSRELTRLLKRNTPNYKPPELLDGFACPITLRMMKNPVFCMLDGWSFEEEDIRKALAQDGKSPVTKEPLAPEQTIDSVLKKNISLKKAIEDYLIKFPELLDDDSPSVVPEAKPAMMALYT